MKKSKYRAKGGGMKGTKYKSMGGRLGRPLPKQVPGGGGPQPGQLPPGSRIGRPVPPKRPIGPKVPMKMDASGARGMSKGGAAYNAEMKANKGMDNIPASVRAALQGTAAGRRSGVTRQQRAMREFIKNVGSKADFDKLKANLLGKPKRKSKPKRKRSFPIGKKSFL
tara:strand:+ start:47 stop:547 length:501 start_codon:yes stop_codon:yes gene_type:complete